MDKEALFLVILTVLAAAVLWARLRDDSLARALRDLGRRQDEE